MVDVQIVALYHPHVLAAPLPHPVVESYDATTASMASSCIRRIELGCALAFAVLVAASGCGDGVGHPIFANSNSDVGASAGAANRTRGDSIGGGGAAALVPGTGGGGTTGTGGAGATGTTADVIVTPLDCAATEQWPTEWAMAEDNLLVLINLFREAGFPCLTGANTSDMTAPSLTMVPALRCAARLHSGSEFSSGAAAARIVLAGFPANQIAEIAFATDETAAEPASVLTTLLLSENQTDCTYLMDSQYTSIGIGFADISGVGYWTIDLASE